MAGLSVLATLIDRFAARSRKYARARADHISETAPERALALFAAAAEAGDIEAAFIVGERYLEGKGTPRHASEAARWYHRAAEAGHMGAQCRLAQLYLFGPSKAAAGQATGLFDITEAGEGADYHAALPWARRAAEAGVADAQAVLAHILTAGPEALRDPEAALNWYQKSAAQDCPQGRLGYGTALLRRADTAAQTSAARDQLRRAAEAGLPAAHYLLGQAANARSALRRTRCKRGITTRPRQKQGSAWHRPGSVCSCSKAGAARSIC